MQHGLFNTKSISTACSFAWLLPISAACSFACDAQALRLVRHLCINGCSQFQRLFQQRHASAVRQVMNGVAHTVGVELGQDVWTTAELHTGALPLCAMRTLPRTRVHDMLASLSNAHFAW